MENVEFKIENKKDSRIYLQGNVDILTIDDTDGGDWEYEQNDGLLSSHLPKYWKVNGEDLSFEYEQFLSTVDWELFRQWLVDCKDENRTVDCGDYILHINEGAKMECEIREPDAFLNMGDYVVEVIPFFNGKRVGIASYMAETFEEFDPWYVNDGSSFIDGGKIYFEMSKDYWDEEFKEERIEDVNEEARRIYAMSLTRELRIYSKYGDVMEQSMDNDYDDEWLFKMSQMVDKSDEELDTFLRQEGLIDEELEY